MKNINRNKRGSAIAFALFIAVILLISEYFLLNQNSNNLVLRKKNVSNLQSYFAAKAALQHTMLKCQLMPTQLYDAASFAAGRNPFFDFGEYTEKPALVFKSIQRDGKYIKLANNLNPGPRFLTKKIKTDYDTKLNAWSEVKEVPENAKDYLNMFKKDIKFDSSDSTTIVYPYNFSYEVSDLSVLAMQEQRKYQEEAVKVTVKGKWKDTISMNEKETTLTAIVRIKRNG